MITLPPGIITGDTGLSFRYVWNQFLPLLTPLFSPFLLPYSLTPSISLSPSTPIPPHIYSPLPSPPPLVPPFPLFPYSLLTSFSPHPSPLIYSPLPSLRPLVSAFLSLPLPFFRYPSLKLSPPLNSAPLSLSFATPPLNPFPAPPQPLP